MSKFTDFPTEYDDGDPIYATVFIDDGSGNGVDPPALTFAYRWSGQTVSAVLTYGADAALTRQSQGNYTAALDSTGHPGLASGQWVTPPGIDAFSQPWEAYVRQRVA